MSSFGGMHRTLGCYPLTDTCSVSWFGLIVSVDNLIIVLNYLVLVCCLFIVHFVSIAIQ